MSKPMRHIATAGVSAALVVPALFVTTSSATAATPQTHERIHALTAAGEGGEAAIRHRWHHRSDSNRHEGHFPRPDYRGDERWNDRPVNQSQAVNNRPDSWIAGQLEVADHWIADQLAVIDPWVADQLALFAPPYYADSRYFVND
jgi:hypothetical protein